MKVVTEMCSELDYGVVDGVGGHTECLRDGICPESPDGGMLSELELEKVVEKGVPLQSGLLDWGFRVSFNFPGLDPEDCEVDPEVEAGLGVLVMFP